MAAIGNSYNWLFDRSKILVAAIGDSYKWLFDRSKILFGVQEILPPTTVSVLSSPGGEATNNLTVSDSFEK